MPSPTQRPSLKTDLASRYSKQKVGGAFDAKNIDTNVGDSVTTDPVHGSGIQDTTFRRGGFTVKESQSGFKDIGNGVSSKQLSIYIKGFNNQRYSN